MAFRKNKISIGSLQPDYVTKTITPDQKIMFETDADLKKLVEDEKVSLVENEITYDSYVIETTEVLRNKNIV